MRWDSEVGTINIHPRKTFFILNAEQITTKIHIGTECTSYWRIKAKQSHPLIKLVTSPDSWGIPSELFLLAWAPTSCQTIRKLLENPVRSQECDLGQGSL